MKKTYMQPQTAVHEIELTQIIAGSEPNANIDKTDDGVAPGSFGTKEQNDWDIWE